MKRLLTLCFLVSLAISAPAARAQATGGGTPKADDALRPAPAAERFEPRLDEWWQDAVFYEVFVRSFADSREGPLANDGVGDLRGLIERLDYLNDGDPATETDLGVTALWLMPITASPSYHGYDTTDYRRIEPDYGTNEDFRDLIVECERRGIRVIIDLVLNHCSSEHPWFEAAARGDADRRDWFIWRGDDPGWRGPWGQPVWHTTPLDPSGAHYYGLFWSGMPDLNYENAAVTREMHDVARFWLEDMGAAGFRLDAVRHLIEDGRVQDNTPATHRWLQDFYRHVKRTRPDAVTVGEVWAPSEDVARYVGDQMDIAFEFSMADAILNAVRSGTAAPMLYALKPLDALYPLGMYATFLRNHDQPRTMHELAGDPEAAELAAAIQLSLPGVPFIYYGEEIGMSADKPDPQIRTPMQWAAGPGVGFTAGTPWIAPKPDAETVNVAAQSRDPGSLLSRYRRMIRARLAEEALRTGELVPIRTNDAGVLIYLRRREEGARDVLCVFNLSDRTAGVRVRSPELLTRTAAPDLLGNDPGGVVREVLTRPLPPRTARWFPLEGTR